MTTKSVNHGPKCLACIDPGEARRQIAAERAALDREATRAAERRKTGEAAREQALQATVGSREYESALLRVQYELGTANALAQNVRMHRAHLDRVEAAHPALRARKGADRA